MTDSRRSTDMAADGVVDGLGAHYRGFWIEFLGQIKVTYPGWTSRSVVQPRNFLYLPAGRTGLRYATVFGDGSPGRRLRIELFVAPKTHAESSWTFGCLNDHRRQIEAALGEPLDWQELPRRKGHRIATVYPREILVTERHRWPEVLAWSVDNIGQLRDAFAPAIASMPEW